MSSPRPNTPSSSYSSSDDESTATTEILDSSSSTDSMYDPMEVDEVNSSSSDESVTVSSSETIDDPMDISEDSFRSSEATFEESSTEEEYGQIRYAANQRFERAEASYKNKDFAKAIEQYNDAIDILKNIPSSDLTVKDFKDFEAYYCNLGGACHEAKNSEQELVAYLSAATMLDRRQMLGTLDLSYYLEWAANYNLWIADCLTALNNNATKLYQDAKLMFSQLELLNPSLETSLNIAKCYFRLKEYQLATVKLGHIIQSYGENDAAWRLLARCSNDLACEMDSGNTVTENTAKAACQLIGAMLAALRIKTPNENDLKRFLTYDENLRVTMADIQNTLHKVDGMRSLFQPSITANVSTSVFSMFAFAPPQVAAAPAASEEKKEENTTQQRMGA